MSVKILANVCSLLLTEAKYSKGHKLTFVANEPFEAVQIRVFIWQKE